MPAVWLYPKVHSETNQDRINSIMMEGTSDFTAADELVKRFSLKNILRFKPQIF